MPDSLPGHVSSMAFTASGDEVWVAHPKYGIEIRSWPAFELQRVLPVLGVFLAGHPNDPYMAVLTHNQILLLDLEGRIIRSWTIAKSTLRAAAFLGDTLQVLCEESAPERGRLLVLWSCSLAGGDPERRAAIQWVKPAYSWWGALLPQKKMAFIACNDHAAMLWRIDAGTLQDAREWAPKPDGSATSWLGVDTSSDERFISWSYKNGQAFIATLNEKGDVASHTGRWLSQNRIASCAIHHRDEVALLLDIKGEMSSIKAHADAQYDGPMPSFTFARGYRWG